MRTWTVAGPHGERCGRCWRETPPGKPIQVIELKGVLKKRTRCVECAEGAVDWDQVAAAKEARDARELAQAGPQFTRFTDVAPTLFDAKAAAAGKDD